MDKKIRMAKTISWQLLKQSYENRNEVCLIGFENNTPVTLIEPTKDMGVVDEKLEILKSGGKTPLTPALYQAAEIISKHKNSKNQVIIISDGKGNVFKNQNLQEDLREIVTGLSDTVMLLINASEKFKSTGQMEKLSEYLSSEHIYLDDLMD
jgi:magnesium chelatase subunit D